MVFVFHVFNSGIVPWPTGSHIADTFTYVVGSLRYGVELFFMISGFVIVASLTRHANIPLFLRDRATRIFSLWIPLHVGICIAGTLWGWKVFPHVTNAHDWWQVFMANLLLIAPFLNVATTHPASWSLSYEWLFYFSAAMTYFAYRKGGPGWALFVAIATAGIYVECMPRALYFVPGVLTFLARKRQMDLKKYLVAPLLSFCIFLLAWSATGVDAAEPGHYFSYWLGDYRIVMAIVAFVAGLHFFCTLASRSSSQLRFLETRFFEVMGSISFSFYLVSPIVMFGVKKIVYAQMTHVFHPWVMLICFAGISLIVSLAASYLSWSLLENRLAHYLKGFFGARKRVLPGEVRLCKNGSGI
jgi:peptidoglycan/LPS O-acetylase OafA/YrhL